MHDEQFSYIDLQRQQKELRCDYCGERLRDRYVEDFWGTRFCPSHRREYPSCVYCSRLVPPGSGDRVGRRHRCSSCAVQAVDRSEQARPIFSRLVNWVTQQGLVFQNLDLSIELLNRQQMADFLRDPQDPKALGAARRRFIRENGRIIRIEPVGVVILRSLPTVLFEGVTIHELGHIWLTVHQVANLPDWAEEGFCELLAHRYWSGSDQAEYRFYRRHTERNPDPVYGEGFRRIAVLAQLMGFSAFLAAMQSSRTLPSGR